MKSKHSPDPRHAEDTTWLISTETRQEAREADACIASDDWLYAAPGPPPRAPQPIDSAAPPRPAAR